MSTSWGEGPLFERLRRASTIAARKALATQHHASLSAEDVLDIAQRVGEQDPELALRAVQLARRLPSRGDQAPDTFRAEGQVLANREQYAAALRRWRRSTSDTDMESAQALTALGHLEQVKALLATTAAKPGMAQSPRFRIMQATYDFARGEFDDSLAALDAVLDKTRERPWPLKMESSVRINRATILATAGRFDEARDEGARALDLVRSEGGVALRAAQYAQARVDLESGRYGRALPQLEALLPFAQEKTPARYAHCSLDIAQLFLQIHLPARALPLTEAAMETFDRLDHPRSAAYARFLRGTALRELKQPDMARTALHEALATYGAMGNELWHAICSLQLAQIEFDMQDLESAYTRALAVSQQFAACGMESREGHAERLLADIEFARGGVPSAMRRLERMLKATEPDALPWLHCSMHHRLARWHQGDAKRALAHSLQAANLVEIHRHVVPPDECMAAFLDEKAHVFMEAVRNTLAVGGPDTDKQVFQLVERSRSRALLDRLADLAEAPADAKRREVEAMRARLPESARSEHPAMRRGLREAIEAQERDIRAATHRAAAASPNATSVEAVRAILGPRDVMYEWFRLDESLLRIRITQAELDVQVHAFSTSELDKLLGRLAFHMGRVSVRPGGAFSAMVDRLAGDAEAALADVGALLFDNEPDPSGWERILAVPSGALHDVPFGALLIDGKPLIASSKMIVNPSASVHQSCFHRAVQGNGPPLIVGVSDVHALEIENEVAEIHAMYPEAVVLRGPEATCAAVVAALPGAAWVHLATHARYDAADPFASGIELADGWCTLRDLNQVTFGPDLVTLSGCATGRVSVSSSEEVFGLARGILAAGARNLLATLWPVGDASTRSFMGRFYQAYRRTGDAASAHQSATLATRDAHPHPFFWAPFALIGAGAPSPVSARL